MYPPLQLYMHLFRRIPTTPVPLAFLREPIPLRGLVAPAYLLSFCSLVAVALSVPCDLRSFETCVQS